LSDKPIKVAYLLGSLERGGTETLLLDCFRVAHEAGFPFIGIHRKDGTLLKSFMETGVPFYSVSFSSRLDIGYIFRLRKLLINQGITIAHAQQSLDALLAWIATRGTGIRIVLTTHSYDFEETSLAKTINWFIFRQTSLNVFVSNTQMNYYVEKFNLHNPSRRKVVYNGISFERFDKHSSNSIRHELGIKNDILLLCSVGNFVPVRDQMTICRFLALLIKKTFDFRMIFAGSRTIQDPHLYDDCVDFCQKEGLADKVLFLGSRSDVPAILVQSDAFIYASDHDTFGIAVIEAIASGIPVFVNDWEVMKEVTDNGRCATIYKTKDEKDLLKLFINFLEYRGSYQERAENAASWVRNTFSINKHFIALKEIYSSLIGVNLINE
jgi:glycosyltransferase involved in cell wall biosynthesis